MLSSHRLLLQYWHDERRDPRRVRIWYIDRGAPGDRSRADGGEVSLEPYYLLIRTAAGEKEIPYHRILLITYDDTAVFENRKIRGRAGAIMAGDPDPADTGTTVP